MDDKYFAIPWNAFHFNLSEKNAVHNVEKKMLENAPGFDKGHWPNMADSTWGLGIYKHYGYTPYWEELSAHSEPVEGPPISINKVLKM